MNSTAKKSGHFASPPRVFPRSPMRTALLIRGGSFIWKTSRLRIKSKNSLTDGQFLFSVSLPRVISQEPCGNSASESHSSRRQARRVSNSERTTLSDRFERTAVVTQLVCSIGIFEPPRRRLHCRHSGLLTGSGCVSPKKTLSIPAKNCQRSFYEIF